MTPRAARRFVFLDRDGTLVRDPGYVHRTEDYELLPGVAAGLRRLQQAGYALAIVTNQSGIGRGIFTQGDFEAFQQRLLADLTREGVTIAATLVCPHAPGAGCTCRKPSPGLLWRARDELGADLARSWMIGDGERDALAARSAGCAGAVLIGPSESAPAGVAAARDFAEAAAIVLAASAPP